jgi:hypothetical protein
VVESRASRLRQRRGERLRGPQRSGPADCPPSANWAGVRLAGLFEVCWKGYEWKFALHHRTEKSDGLASMRGSCAWVDLDRFGGLDRRPARGSAEVDRGGVSRHPSAKGLRGLGECGGALPLSARSPVRAAFCAPTGLRDGCGAGGEGGAPLRGHQRAIVMPVPAQIVWSECPDQTGRCRASLIRSTRSGPSKFKEDPPLLGGQSSTRTRTDERLGSGAHTSRLYPSLNCVVCESTGKCGGFLALVDLASLERPCATPTRPSDSPPGCRYSRLRGG